MTGSEKYVICKSVLSSIFHFNNCFTKQTKNKLRGFSPQANYTDRTNAACRRS
jgi:hypothetical protein